jgi:hypothetical protein
MVMAFGVMPNTEPVIFRGMLVSTARASGDSGTVRSDLFLVLSR